MHSVEEIISACAKGKQWGQKILFESYSKKMFAVCTYYTTEREDAEDVLHDGFIKIFENIHKYTHDGNFEAWMRRIFINQALMLYRRNKRIDFVSEIAEMPTINHEMYEEGSLEFEELVLLVKQLPPQYQLVFNLYAIEGFKHKEIGEMLKIDEGTSKSNLARARKILQEKLKVSFVEYERV